MLIILIVAGAAFVVFLIARAWANARRQGWPPVSQDHSVGGGDYSGGMYLHGVGSGGVDDTHRKHHQHDGGGTIGHVFPAGHTSCDPNDRGQCGDASGGDAGSCDSGGGGWGDFGGGGGDCGGGGDGGGGGGD